MSLTFSKLQNELNLRRARTTDQLKNECGTPAVSTSARFSIAWRIAWRQKRHGTISFCPAKTTRQSLSRVGLRPENESRPRDQRSFCGRERHRQNHGRGSDRQ